MFIRISNGSKLALFVVIIYSLISFLFGYLFIEKIIFLPNFNNFIIFNQNIEPNYKDSIFIFSQTIIGFLIGNIICDSNLKSRSSKSDHDANKSIKGNYNKIILLKISNKTLFIFFSLILLTIVILLIYKITLDDIGFENRYLKYSWASPLIAATGIYLAWLLKKVNVLGYILIHILASFVSLLIAYAEISRDFLLIAFPFLLYSSLYKFKNFKSLQLLAKGINFFTIVGGIYIVSFLRGGLRINTNFISFLNDGLFYLTGFSFFNLAQQLNGDISGKIMSLKNLITNFQITKINTSSIEYLALKGELFDRVRPIPAAIHLHFTNPYITITIFIVIGYLISKIFSFNKSISIFVISYSALFNILIGFYQYGPRQFFRGIHILIFIITFLYFQKNYTIKFR